MKKLTEQAIETARKSKLKTVRLDVFEGDTVPKKMLAGCVFEYIDTIEMRYENIGELMRFRLMELVL